MKSHVVAVTLQRKYRQGYELAGLRATTPAILRIAAHLAQCGLHSIPESKLNSVGRPDGHIEMSLYSVYLKKRYSFTDLMMLSSLVDSIL